MGVFDDNVAIIGDWVPPPSPGTRALHSGLLGDEFSTRLTWKPSIDNKSGGIFPWSQEQIKSWKTDDKDQLTNSSSFSEQKMNSSGGLLERMAARAGFNAPRLNTESIRLANLSQNPDVRSPYLTIPPGLSPTTLLESPVLLSNSNVQPSPTTGKLSFASSGIGINSTLGSETPGDKNDDFFEDISTSSFAFKPVAESGTPLFSCHTSNITSTSIPQQNFTGIEVSLLPESSLWSQNTEPARVESQNGTDSSRKDAEHSPSEQQDEESDQIGDGDTIMVGSGPSGDGYNWRKYGQKQVKGSEYPRSYFKCTHTNCLVKKMVERAHDGQITKIVYKGAHNHTKPTPNPRLAIGSDLQLDIDYKTGAQIGADGDPRWMTAQSGTTGGAREWRQDNREVTSSISVAAEYCNAPKNGTHFESGEAVDGRSTFSNEDEDDDCGTHGSLSLDYDGEGDDSESKKRKLEAYATEMSGATRALREPRVVVQTTSEVDLLDDGYRWRKYGQKVVKGNPNPRSYYKCTSTGCTVRKHVERAPHDLKSVITTYEGKHNHSVPAARSSVPAARGGDGVTTYEGKHNHSVPAARGSVPAARGGNSVTHANGPAQGARAAAGSVSAHLHRPEPSQPQKGKARYDQPSGLSSLGLPARQQLGFGMNQPGLPNLAMAGLGPGQGKPPVMPYLASEMGFMLPKEEPKGGAAQLGVAQRAMQMRRCCSGTKLRSTAAVPHFLPS
ncbi:hypothetical protein Vadar_011033 [Vaccinium darrowii]|uniref:Uncharacterized protein n=1 Tax=Vaccinium darrowii TaxID=229202 RepID=A0ACB7Z2T9_9ERIC|nr:hypothetical protein Vadar_011033 [Vaccinium darrowii]